MCAPRRDDIPYYFQTVDEIYFPFQRLYDLFPLCHDHYYVDVLLHDPRLRDDILSFSQTSDETYLPLLPLSDLQMWCYSH